MTDWDTISAPELERLSAYLDGELKPAEAARLEARLREDAALRQALDDLRRTVQAVRSLPAATAPRDFRLTEQVAARAGESGPAGIWNRLARLRTYPALQLGTALAGLALVVLIGFDVLVNSSLAGFSLSRDAAPAAAPFSDQGAAQAIESVELQDAPALAPAEQQPQPTPGPEQALGAAEQQTEAEPEAEELQRSVQATEQAETEAEQELEAAAAQPEEELPAGEPEHPAAEADQGEQVGEAEDELQAGELEQAAPDASADQGPDAQNDLDREPEPAAAAPPPSEQQPAAALRAAGRTALTVAEIGLGLATLSLLVLTLRARRRA